jgi:hypothetical protein
MDDARDSAELAVNWLKEFPDGKARDSLEKLGKYIVDRDI